MTASNMKVDTAEATRAYLRSAAFNLGMWCTGKT
jgi:hypothetical protein